MLTGILTVVLALSAPAPEETEPLLGMSEVAFRRAFEHAVEEEDDDRARAVVRANPTRLAAQFRKYSYAWYFHRGMPGPKEHLVLRRAEALAEAANEALGAPGLLAVVERMRTADDAAREAWHRGMKLWRQGEDTARRHEWQKALEPLEQSAEAFESAGVTLDQASVLGALGQHKATLGSYQEAIELQERVLSLLEPMGDPLETAGPLNAIGICHARMGDTSTAIEYFERAHILSEPSGRPEYLAAGLMNIGTAYYNLGRHEEALERFEGALALLEPLGDKARIAIVLHNLGNLCMTTGRTEDALAYRERSYALRKGVGNPREIAFSLTVLGESYKALGRFDEALDCHERAVALHESIGNPQHFGGALVALGVLNHVLGRNLQAERHLRRAVEILEPLGNPADTGNVLNALGNCLHGQGRHAEAIEIHGRSLALLEQAGNPVKIGMSLTCLAMALEGTGDREKAVETYRRALEIQEKGRHAWYQSVSLLHLGLNERALGHHEKALEYLGRSAALRESMGMPAHLAASLYCAGQCEIHLGRPERAIETFRQANAALEKLSLRSLSAADQSLFRECRTRLGYEASRAAVLLPEGSAAVADCLRMVESQRSRSLIGELSARQEGVTSAADPELSRRRGALTPKLEALRLQLQQARLEANDADAERLQADLAAMMREYDAVTEKLRRSDASFMELTRPEAARAEEIQRLALSDDRALLEYVLGADESFLWVVTKDDVRVFALPAEAELRDTYDRLREALAPTRSADASFVAPARELFVALLGDAAEALSAFREWIIVPDGFLGYLPFEVLLTADTEPGAEIDLAALPYLVRQTSVSYAPSGSFLTFLARQRASGDKKWTKDALLLGDPVYASERIDTANLAYRRVLSPEGFERLRMTRDEVTSIAAELVDETEGKLFFKLRDLPRSGSIEGKRFDLHVGAEVNAARITGDLRGYRIVHVATHGYFDPEFPWFSGLALTDAGEDQPGSGFLNLLELGRLRLDAEIVFLSACETGTGQQLKSEGIQSTARSFLIAGAESVLATQWSVRDDVASVVARTFYGKLFEGAPPAAALREAKLQLIREGSPDRGVAPIANDAIRNPHAHPSIWAPFVQFGDAR